MGTWRQIRNDINWLVNKYGFTAIVTSAVSLIKSGYNIMKGIASLTTPAGFIAGVLGLTVEIVLYMLGGLAEKLTHDTERMSDDDWHIFNWNVIHQNSTFLCQPYTQTLYAYCKLAYVC